LRANLSSERAAISFYPRTFFINPIVRIVPTSVSEKVPPDPIWLNGKSLWQNRRPGCGLASAGLVNSGFGGHFDTEALFQKAKKKGAAKKNAFKFSKSTRSGARPAATPRSRVVAVRDRRGRFDVESDDHRTDL
jgi:hypothetical protein